MGRYYKAIKLISLVLILSIVAAVFCGCGGNTNSGNPYRSIKSSLLPTQSLASNSSYDLSWDSEAKAVIFKSLENETYWSDILYDKFLEGYESANGSSPISITVANTKTLKWDTITSYEMLEQGGNIACKKIENGIRVTYFFENYKIAVPVEYTIREDAVNVAIDGKTILEDGTDYKLVSVALTPNFCSIKNDAENGYLFVPSGCGAIMYAKENDNGVRKYSGEVYGADGARQVPTDFVDDESVRLPVFGVSNNKTALFGIIEEGMGAAVIEAQAGNDRLGYSNICANFYVRGYDKFFFTYHGKPQGTTSRINENISQNRMSVSYYPLFDEDANYSGMAKKYREYLESQNLLEKSDLADSSYSLTFLGGTGVTKSILGIPKKELAALTTFEEATDIVSKIKKDIGEEPVVRLLGYGNKGIRPGKIAGGKGFSSVYGSKVELAKLLKSVPYAFIDYDIVRFADSGNGFSLLSDVATTAIKYKAEHFAITPIRIMDEDNPYYIISRDKLLDAADYAIKKSEKFDNKSVSLSSLGTIAFSDYSFDDYINKNKIEEDVIAALTNVKNKGKFTAVSGANSYAASAADMIFDTVSTSGDYSVFDFEVPFYQMVFHSYKTMYSEPLNISENTKFALARSLAYGMGTSFMITANYVDNSDDLDEYPLYGTYFEDNRKLIKDSVISSGFDDIYKRTMNSKLIDYSMLENGVSVSTFENGIILYVNQTEKEVNSPIGVIEPYSFLEAKGE